MNIHHQELHSAERPRVAILAYEGLNLFEYAIVLDALGDRSAEIGPHWYTLEICAETLPIGVQGGMSLTSASPLSAMAGASMVVVPGWRLGAVPRAITEALRNAHSQGARIASICTGAFVLAAAGLLDGRRATTHWKYATQLAQLHPSIAVDPDVLYVDEGDIVTSAGSAAGIDMLLHVIRSDFGASVSNKVARMLVVPPHRDGGQAQYFDRPVPPVAGSAFAKLIDQLRRDPTREYTIAELARLAAMSSRTLFRSFKAATGHTPYEWLLRERLRLAKEMLETTSMTVDQIAYQAGLGSADTMRHHFQRLVGTTPRGYRRTFGGERLIEEMTV
jgi:AraC family transcriptional activator FtrA